MAVSVSIPTQSCVANLKCDRRSIASNPVSRIFVKSWFCGPRQSVLCDPPHTALRSQPVAMIDLRLSKAARKIADARGRVFARRSACFRAFIVEQGGQSMAQDVNVKPGHGRAGRHPTRQFLDTLSGHDDPGMFGRMFPT